VGILQRMSPTTAILFSAGYPVIRSVCRVIAMGRKTQSPVGKRGLSRPAW
jgi:hypothetical protein